jgi:hypothetical protein
LPAGPAFSELAPPPFCQPRGSSTSPAFGYFFRYWECGKVIKIAGPSAIVTPAINEWNAALLPDSFPGLPRFQYASSGADITVVVDGSGSGLYCGDTFVVDSQLVHLKVHTPVGSPCTSNWSDAITTLEHELGHVLGYQSGGHKIPPDYCTFRLPDDPASTAPSASTRSRAYSVRTAFGRLPMRTRTSGPSRS